MKENSMKMNNTDIEGEKCEVYLNAILDQTPRLLGLLDRNESSGTFGCFDRNYWHYKYIDFPCARKQEAVLTLSLLYCTENRKNPYYENENILKWINAGCRFWSEIQRKNGSFDEWYPYESSFITTAFSTYAVTESLLLCENLTRSEKVMQSLRRAAGFLMSTEETRVQNQESGAAAALYNAFLLTEDPKYRTAAKKKLQELANSQNEEGWFLEYGGADIGYLSLTVDYLSKYFVKNGDEDVLHMIEKAVDYLNYFIHPDFTFGGEYGSRNTEYLIPHGFELMSSIFPAASNISFHIRKSLSERRSIGPFNLDDRYLAYIGYTWLQAYRDSKNLATAEPLYGIDFSKIFNNSGIYIYSRNGLYFIVNFFKGGSFVLFKNNRVIYDTGVEIQSKHGNFTSAVLCTENEVVVAGDGITVHGQMCPIKSGVMTPVKKTVMNAFQLSIGKLNVLNKYVKEKLRNTLISFHKKTNIEYVREIKIVGESVFVTDEIGVSALKGAVKHAIIQSRSSYTYTPSSRYFAPCAHENLPVKIPIEKEADRKKIKREF